MNKREAVRGTVRGMVRTAYDTQKLRIQMGNRLAADFRSQLGQAPGQKEEELSKEAKEIIEALKLAYHRITDGIAENIFKINVTKFKGHGLISDYGKLMFVHSYIAFEMAEREQFKAVEAVLKQLPIYDFLKDVKGIGPRMAGAIVSEIDIHKAETASSLWKYAGLDVAADGRGRGRYVEHQIEVEYVDKEGNDATRMSITFNPWLKIKMIGVLGKGFLRSRNEKYSEVYYNYKHRLENSPKHSDKTKGHRHNMAIRYMVKRFLVDLYLAWRPLEGLPVTPEYSVAKLGIQHG